MSTLRWMHISDIHFGRPRETDRLDQTLVLRHLASDAHDLALKIGRPDLIFITGDVAYEGVQSQFSGAADWLLKMIDDMDMPPNRLFVVPGNHDVDRNKIKQSYLARLAHNHLRENHDDLNELLKTEQETACTLWPKLEEYAAFCKQVGAPEATAAEPAWHRVLDLGPGRVVIVGLSSVMLSQDNFDKGKLALGRKQLEKLTEDDTAAFFFVLVHHPLSWLGDQSEGQLINALYGKAAALLLSGHLHQQRVITFIPQEDRGFVNVRAGAAHNERGVTTGHCYNWGQFCNGHLEIWRRVCAYGGQQEDRFEGNDPDIYINALPGSLRQRLSVTTTRSPQKDVSRLAHDAHPESFVGRRNRIDELLEAFSAPDVQVSVITGPDGQGKTALISEFVRVLLSPQDSRPFFLPHQVFAWSFRSGQAGQTSSEQFFMEARKFFGDKEQVSKNHAAILCDLIGSVRTLLVLDGLDALGLGAALDEHLHTADRNMTLFLTKVSRTILENGGLIIISSLHPISVLAGKQTSAYRWIELEPLSDWDAHCLLWTSGIHAKGTRAALVAACRGHPLSLVLGKWLLTTHSKDEIERILAGSAGESAGDVLNRLLQTHLTQAEEMPYLQMVALSPRGLRDDEIQALKDSEIGKPTRRFTPQEEATLLEKMREKQLLSLSEIRDEAAGYSRGEEVSSVGRWSMPAVVGRYISESLKHRDLCAWRDGHRVLFIHLEKTHREQTKCSDLITPESLRPLYESVEHGCMAGMQREAFDIYRRDIARDYAGFSTERLGLASRDLEALAAFFPMASDGTEDVNRWDRLPEGNLTEEESAWLLARVAYCLECEGRFEESVIARTRSNAAYEACGIACSVAQGYEELALLQVYRGQLVDATEAAEVAIQWSNKIQLSDNQDERYRQPAAQAILATVLHKMGDISAADEHFQIAEKLHKEIPQEAQVMHSSPGARYALFLLDAAKDRNDLHSIRRRAEEMLSWSREERGADKREPLIEGIHHLVLGCALTELGELDQADGEITSAVGLIDEVRHKSEFGVEALLASARFCMRRIIALPKEHEERESLLSKAILHLNECGEICKSYRLPLYEADASLLRAFVLLGGLDVNPEERQAEAIESQRSARKIIQRYGYSLRQPELDILGAYVASLEGREAEQKTLLALAQSAVEKRNSIRLRSEWQAVVEKMASLRAKAGSVAKT